MTTFTNTAIATVTAASLMLGALTATTTTASAGSLSVGSAVATLEADGNLAKVGWRHRHHRRHGYVGPAAAGAIFGLAAGAMIAGAHRERDCYWTVVKKKRWNRYGERVIIKKRVRVCD